MKKLLVGPIGSSSVPNDPNNLVSLNVINVNVMLQQLLEILGSKDGAKRKWNQLIIRAMEVQLSTFCAILTS